MTHDLALIISMAIATGLGLWVARNFSAILLALCILLAIVALFVLAACGAIVGGVIWLGAWLLDGFTSLAYALGRRAA